MKNLKSIGPLLITITTMCLGIFVFLVVLSVRSHRATAPISTYQGVAIKATDWPLHATKVCMFFGRGTGSPVVGCWDSEDNDSVFNKNDAVPDQIFLVDISVSKETKEALTAEHNEKAYCIRDTYTHLSCKPGN